MSAIIDNVSSTGDILVVFNKPIIEPMIQSNNDKQKEPTRALMTKSSLEKPLFKIEDVVKVWVESEFYDLND